MLLLQEHPGHGDCLYSEGHADDQQAVQDGGCRHGGQGWQKSLILHYFLLLQAWAANIIKSKFEDPLPSEDLKDHFMRGEWDVIMELIEKLPGAKEGKVRTKEGYLKQDRNIC